MNRALTGPEWPEGARFLCVVGVIRLSSPFLRGNSHLARPVATGVSGLFPLIRLLRPRQWIKNGVVAAALVFAGRLTDTRSIWLTLGAVCIFCLISSAGYIVNDVVDRAADQLHPVKKYRPIAAGLVGPRFALVVAGGLMLLSLAASLAIRPGFLVVSVAYAAVTAIYSLLLKQIPVLDLLAVAGGFLLRAIAGAVAISVPVSGWLLTMTTLLALFIIVAKRLTDASPASLRGLRGPYPRSWLRLTMTVLGATCLVAYCAYCIVSGNLPADHAMLLSVPFVALGLWRYAHLSGAVGSRKGPWITASPDEAIVRDQPLLAMVACWAIASIAALYWIR